jgi:hypothetical protein
MLRQNWAPTAEQRLVEQLNNINAKAIAGGPQRAGLSRRNQDDWGFEAEVRLRCMANFTSPTRS